MKTTLSKTTYLEMFSPPEEPPQPPPKGAQIVRVEKPTVRFYRYLYDAVGRDWNWLDRKVLSDADLAHTIQHQQVQVHVLYVQGSPAGFGELDRRKENEVQLMYFGIMPEFFGRGLGCYFLRRMVDIAWSYGPKRVWVHTCDQDHKAALPLYLKTGFEIFDERLIEHPLPE